MTDCPRNFAVELPLGTVVVDVTGMEAPPAIGRPRTEYEKVAGGVCREVPTPVDVISDEVRRRPRRMQVRRF